MATPADQRLLELLGKWLKSLELHAKYASLDDDSYWKIQPWVEHQRPSRWIIDVAKQKTLALKAHVEERVKTGDSKYSDSLELMIFLANLVGSEHIERFIPLADPEAERSLTAEPPNAGAHPTTDTATREMPLASATATQEAPLVSATATREMPAVSASATREMPKFLAAKRTPPPAGTAQVARTERKAAVPAKPAAKPAAKQPAKPARPSGKPAPKAATAPSERDGRSDVARAQVIADAARLVQWGRKWYELPELIARMADRPTLPEVRRILKENKSAIDAKAGGA
jgi:hypothetical protein